MHCTKQKHPEKNTVDKCLNKILLSLNLSQINWVTCIERFLQWPALFFQGKNCHCKLHKFIYSGFTIWFSKSVNFIKRFLLWQALFFQGNKPPVNSSLKIMRVTSRFTKFSFSFWCPWVRSLTCSWDLISGKWLD